MKRIQQALLGCTAFRLAPSSVEEFNTLAKGDKILDYADAEAYYRSVAPKVRSEFIDTIGKELSHTPKVIDEKTVGEGDAARVIKTFEKDTTFIKRVKAAGVTDEVLNEILQRAYDTVGYDLTSSRATGANKSDLDGADFYISAVANGESTWDRIVANFEGVNPGLVIAREDDGSVSREVMGEAVKINRLRLAATRML